MDIAKQIADMTIRIEQGEETRQEVYNLLLLALLEIKEFSRRIARLEAEVLNQ